LAIPGIMYADICLELLYVILPFSVLPVWHSHFCLRYLRCQSETVCYLTTIVVLCPRRVLKIISFVLEVQQIIYMSFPNADGRKVFVCESPQQVATFEQLRHTL
jgi:hypothetical protein